MNTFERRLRRKKIIRIVVGSVLLVAVTLAGTELFLLAQTFRNIP